MLLAAHKSLHLKHVIRRFLLLNESQRPPPYSLSYVFLFGHSARYSPSCCHASLCPSFQQILSTSLQSVPPAAKTIARPSYDNSLPSDPICFLFRNIQIDYVSKGECRSRNIEIGEKDLGLLVTV
jgi:hypothetical protein